MKNTPYLTGKEWVVYEPEWQVSIIYASKALAERELKQARDSYSVKDQLPKFRDCSLTKFIRIFPSLSGVSFRHIAGDIVDVVICLGETEENPLIKKGQGEEAGNNLRHLAVANRMLA